MTPSVSICVPTYNGASYLSDCLESIQAQTWKDFEALILDDGSTDDTYRVALGFASRDARFIVSRNERNLGLVGNWNLCVGKASGEWLKFVFQDDMLAPDCLSRLLAVADRENSALVACSRDFKFDEQTPIELRQWYYANRDLIEQLWGIGRFVGAEEFCAATLARVGANVVGEPTSVLLSRALFSRFGLFNPDLIMSCDLEYWMRVAVNYGFRWVPERLAMFRVHDAATSSVNRSKRAFRMNVLDDLIVLHQCAYDPNYANLRQAAAKQAPPLDLRALFHEKAAWAVRVARTMDESSQSAGGSAIEEWERVAARYPRIRGDLSGRIRHVVTQMLALGRALSHH